MKVTVKPGKISGDIKVISSKSYAHRFIIAAALSDEPTKISNVSDAEDVLTTIEAVKALGAKVEKAGDDVVVTPIDKTKLSDTVVKIHCNESGSTLRFLMPIVAAITNDAVFYAKGRLPLRPIYDLKAALSSHGKEFSMELCKEDLLNEENLGDTDGFDEEVVLFRMQGKLTGGKYELPGDVSSQYVSGLLMGLPLLNEDSTIELTTQLQSINYVEMTRQVLFRFDVDTDVMCESMMGYSVPGNLRYKTPRVLSVNCDWSNAAFFICLNELFNESAVTIKNMDYDFLQGDSCVTRLISMFRDKRKRVIDIKNIPDMLPPLAVVAACKEGITEFVDGKRLRFKESDRLFSTVNMINSLGGCAKETESGIMVEGTGLKGGIVNAFRDHRIVMAAAIAGLVAKGDVVIEEAEAVKKSYPSFFEELKRLGAKISVKE